MAYYLKYRPQKIAELDNSILREKLTAILSKEDIPHAFLFTGPKGLGKTSTARIIAKVVNCERRAPTNQQVTENPKNKELDTRSPLLKANLEPCNECDMCMSITNGTNIDVLEIDGASNRGIDEIRDLREKVKLSPARARKKVYIIDEVHMLTSEAFNALLKTIEEPPAHVIFIFCTTEPQKVPDTIISRCIHIALSRATDEELVRSLQRIVEGEKLTITQDALLEIARLADGGFRDGAKMLEEAVAFVGEKEITKELVDEKLHVSSVLYLVSRMLESLSQKNIKGSLEVVQKVVSDGVDIKYFISQLLYTLHEYLLVTAGIKENMKDLVLNTKYTLSEIQQLGMLLDSTYQQTKYSVIPQLPLEILVVKWCSQTLAESPHVSVKEPAAQQTTQEKIDSRDLTVSKQMTDTKNKPTLKELYKKEQTLKVQQILKGEKEPKAQEAQDTRHKENAAQEDLPMDKGQMEVLMENIIYKIKPFNHSVAGVLRGCSIAMFADGILTLQTAYKFHKERLEEHKVREILEQVVREITGRQSKIVVELIKE